MPQRFDVAVAGSGPAGAATAYHLARQGYSVALVDDHTFPRPKLCGEYLNAGAVRELLALGLADQLESSAKLTGMRLFAHGETVEFPFSPQARSVPRKILDDRIRALALSAGARAIFGRVRGLKRSDSGMTLELDSDGEASECEARYVIGADGMRSAVARLLGLTTAHQVERFAMGGHYALEGLAGWLEMYVGQHGYLAVNPTCCTSANAMFVLNEDYMQRHRDDLTYELSRFSARVSDGRRSLSDSQSEEKRRAIGPLAHRTREVTHDKVILVGDAAHFVDPFTGQGVYMALAGARRAAGAIACALKDESEKTRAWAAYSSEHTRSIRERERLAWLVRTVLASRRLSLRAARALRRRPADFAPLVEAVCGNATMQAPELVRTVVRTLR